MCLSLAMAGTRTPVDYWMRVPVCELPDWVNLTNKTNKDEERRQKALQRRG